MREPSTRRVERNIIIKKHETMLVCEDCDAPKRRVFLYGVPNDLKIPVLTIPKWLCNKCLATRLSKADVPDRSIIVRSPTQVFDFRQLRRTGDAD